MILGLECLIAGFLAAQSQPPASWYTHPEWWLVILGLPTLIFVAIQAVQAKNAARAALLNAQAVIYNERPWILLGNFRDERRNYHRDGIDVVMTFSNYGNTPAWIIETSLRFLLIDEEALSSPLEYAAPTTYGNGEAVPPGKTLREIRIPIEIVEYLVGRPNEGVHVFFGYIKYRDAFYDVTKQIRETWVRVRFEKPDRDVAMDRPGQWVPDGPPEANRHT